MRLPGALTCPHCGAPVQHGAPACAWCGGVLAWADHVPLDALEPDDRWDLRAGPPPGLPGDPGEVTDDGRRFSVPADTVRWGTLPGPLLHGAVGLKARAVDANGGFGLIARFATTGDVRTAYALTVRPDARSFRIERVFQDGRGHTARDVIHDWTTTLAIAPVGEWTKAELRFADTVLEVRIGHSRVARTADAAFGYGLCGWRLGAWEAPATVEVAEVWRGGLR